MQALTLAALGLAGAADVYEHRMRTDKVGVSEVVAIFACCENLPDSPARRPKARRGTEIHGPEAVLKQAVTIR